MTHLNLWNVVKTMLRVKFKSLLLVLEINKKDFKSIICFYLKNKEVQNKLKANRWQEIIKIRANINAIENRKT